MLWDLGNWSMSARSNQQLPWFRGAGDSMQVSSVLSCQDGASPRLDRPTMFRDSACG